MKKEKNNSCHFYPLSHLPDYIFAFTIVSLATSTFSYFSFDAKLQSINQMLYLLISCVSFILISKSFTHKPIQSWEGKLKLSSFWFWGEFSSFLVSWFQKSRLAIVLFQPIICKFKKMMTFSSRVGNVEERDSLSLLDLPDLTLECILEKLSPSGLCTMGGVCTSLRERCRDDRLWERHMMEKWGRLIGAAAYREWQLHVASRSRVRNISDQTKKKGLFESLVSKIWPFSWIRPKLATSDCKVRTSLPVESVMSLYLSLESGKFWFPAQVYNREVRLQFDTL